MAADARLTEGPDRYGFRNFFPQRLSVKIPARVFFALYRRASPSLLNKIWRWWYQYLANAYEDAGFRFMNYGYAQDDGLELAEGDEDDRLGIQLYHAALAGIPTAGTRVLEVSSGRGGGACWVARYFEPAEMIGLDFSPDAVGLCREWYTDQPNLHFKVGNAESLPFPSQRFDTVLSVESSHCYGDMSSFISEAFRVLVEGGRLCWADFRDPLKMQAIELRFTAAGFTLASKEDVTSKVIASLDQESARRRKAIREHVPMLLRPSFEAFAGVPGTWVYNAFRRRDLAYFCYVWVKPTVSQPPARNGVTEESIP